MPPTDSPSRTTSIASQLPDNWQSRGAADSHLRLTNTMSPFTVCVRPEGGYWAVQLQRRHASTQPELLLNERYEFRQTAAEQAIVWTYVISLTLAEVTDE